MDTAPDPAEAGEIAGEVSLASLALLERLGPEERAAFLLKEAFDYDYATIGKWLGDSEANCRQLVHRARERLPAGPPRFAVPRERLGTCCNASWRLPSAATGLRSPGPRTFASRAVHA